ncbi:MAG: tetratricopeptide repeat protein [Candidatus Omnitrophica bacterium]|nr:tetratricopeptide repeat protein [Candidatus Omnitrophota bacterium]
MKSLYCVVFAIFLAGCACVPVEKTRNTARSFYIQGLLYEVDGDLVNALWQYNKSLEKDPRNGFLYGKIGRTLLKEKKYIEAEKMFRKAISIDKEEPENYLNLGLTYYYMKAYEKAISYIDKGLKIKETPSYRLILCDLYTATAQYDKALESYNILIKEFPSNFLLHYNAGLLSVKLNKEKESEQYFQNAINFQPAFVKSYIELGSLYERQNRIETAIQYYGKAMEISPQDPSSYEKLIKLYIKQNNWKEVENVLTKAIKKNLQSSIVYQILGSISFQNKRYSEAEIYYKRALMIKEEPTIWFNLGVIYDRMRNKNEMEKCMRRVIGLDKNHHLALNYLGYSFLLEDKNIDEALNMIQKAVKLDPSNGAYLDSLGWAYYKKGNYKMAEKFLNMAKEKETDPEIFEHLGHLYYKKNDDVRAIYWWIRAQEISPKEEISQMIERTKQRLSTRKK